MPSDPSNVTPAGPLGDGAEPHAATAALLRALHEIFGAEPRPGAHLAAEALRAAIDAPLPPNLAQPRQMPQALRAVLAARGPDAEAGCHAPSPGSPAAKAATATDGLAALPWEIWDPWRASGIARPEPGPLPFAIAVLVGPGAPYPSQTAVVGLFAQAPGAYYPPHAHAAEETYAILRGTALWSLDGSPETPQPPGSLIFHPSQGVHATRTIDAPLLAAWRWSGDLSPGTYRLLTDA
ncbi:MAG: dimethylsulfonioproprionate lyase family protein [Pikeienuella sp.]